MKTLLVVSEAASPAPVLVAARTLHMHASLEANGDESALRTCFGWVRSHEFPEGRVNCFLTVYFGMPWISALKTHLFRALSAAR